MRFTALKMSFQSAIFLSPETAHKKKNLKKKKRIYSQANMTPAVVSR